MTHSPRIFKSGDIVMVVRKTKKADGWSDEWSDEMDRTIGRRGVVVDEPSETSGYRVQLDRSVGDDGYGSSLPLWWYYPSCALELAAAIRAGESLTNLASAIGVPIPEVPMPGVPIPGVPIPEVPMPGVPKRRAAKRRTFAMPERSAVCTHLRWLLMGFIKEKLVLDKEVIYNNGGAPATGVLDELSIACKKCGTTTTMRPA